MSSAVQPSQGVDVAFCSGMTPVTLVPGVSILQYSVAARQSHSCPFKVLDMAGRSDWQGRGSRAVHGSGHFGCYPALGWHEGFQMHCGHQLRSRCSHFPGDLCRPLFSTVSAKICRLSV